jgi:hypothetical protein
VAAAAGAAAGFGAGFDMACEASFASLSIGETFTTRFFVRVGARLILLDCKAQFHWNEQQRLDGRRLSAQPPR